MPNNCSALIQRKQQILHKIIRSNSESKLQNAVTETTNELHVAGTRKPPAYSSSANHLTTGPSGASAIRRSTLFHHNRVQPSADHLYQTHLPSIRDAAGPLDRHTPLYDDAYGRTRLKTPGTTTSPKSTTRPPSNSMSSLYNALAKRSTENVIIPNGEFDELLLPPSRQSRRPSNEHITSANQTPTKLNLIPHKYSGDSGVDTRYSIGSPDANQQQRTTPISSRTRHNIQNAHETTTKERTTTIQHYQRRTNNTVRAPIKQRIDKYRRRSEEAAQATNGNTLLASANAGLSATSPALTTPSSARPKPPPSTPMPVRRVTSDAEIQSRLEVLRLSMNTSLAYTDQQHSHPRTKSPQLYSTHQQLASPVTPQTPSVLFRRQQQISSATPSQPRHNSSLSHRRQQQLSAGKQSTNTGQENLYLAFIASRHLSTLENTLFESDIDHPRLFRIFTWLKNVEKHRHQQADHDQLIIEQNQRMLDQEENFSLYSEVKYAVDDLPANTSGIPCEKIATMQFED